MPSPARPAERQPRAAVVHLYDPEPTRAGHRVAVLEAARYAIRHHADRDTLFDALRAERRPACIVSDVANPAMDGLALLADLYDNGLALPVVIIDGEAPVPVVARVMKAGAVDFLVRPVRAVDLVAAVDQAIALAGEIGPGDVLPVATAERLAALTDKEREVLGGLMQGHTSRSIAEQLGISPRTVEIHRGRVLVKMQATNVAHVVRMMLRRPSPDDTE
jgi:two-component system response regulator FixJ